MPPVRVLHVDDEPDIRAIVACALALDDTFAVQSCSSGEDALAVAPEWSPDIILLDVMMPVMDGPATLARLRENSETATVPVVFMTARAQAREVAQFRSLGAVGVIAKPFDPMTLADSLRGHLAMQKANLSELRASFLARARADAAALLVRKNDASTQAREKIRDIAHRLAGVAGIYGFDRIGIRAAELEEAVVAHRAGAGGPMDVDFAIDALAASIACIAGDHVQH
jgi:CheY-like chemotaxis protein